MAQKIDYDRGVFKRIHPAGMSIYMYQDEPGIFRNAFSSIVDPKLAAEAGFDTITLGKMKDVRSRKLAALKAIDEAMDVEVERDIVVQRKGFKIVHTGMGRHFIEDPDGNILNDNALSVEVAKSVLDGLTPEEVPVEDVKGKK